MAKLIKMVRHKEGFKAPYDADVNPKEVANYQAAGWTKVKPVPRKRTTRNPRAAAKTTKTTK